MVSILFLHSDGGRQWIFKNTQHLLIPGYVAETETNLF